MSKNSFMDKNYKWYVVGMLWLICFFNYADRQAMSSVLPLLEKEMGLTTVQLGWLTAAFAWVYGLSAPFSGNIADRIKRRTAILGGLQAWSVVCAATALATNFFQLVFFRSLIGLGESIYYPAAMSLVSDYHGKSTRSRVMGIHQTGVYIGTIGGSFFAGLIGQYYGWRLSFLVFGGLGVLLGLLMYKTLREPKRGAADLADIGAKSDAHLEKVMPLKQFMKVIWGTPTVLLLMSAFMCANFVALVVLSWMPKFLYDKFHLSLAGAGLTATLYIQLASMVGCPLGGYLADVLRKRTPGGRIAIQAAGVLCGAPFVFLCGQTQSVAWLIVALTAWGLFKGFYDANIFASVYDVVRPEARGTAAGFMNSIGWIGGGAAPVVIGYVARSSSLSYAISMTAVVYIMAAALLLCGVLFTVKKDAARMEAQLAAEARG
jgi:MFS family permease